MKIGFEIFWRLAILALPWQTRWFGDAGLAGWPWEQGRVSVYLSWVFIFLAVISGRKRLKEIPLDANGKPLAVMGMVALFMMSLFATTGDQSALQAAMMWWLQIGILVAFVSTLLRNGVAFRSLAVWFCVSLLPHAALGFWQFASQSVGASTLFGIAAQVPASLGVSVVEVGGMRILRAYGGFPHPNIFGGWLAVGSLAAFWLAARAKSVSAGYRWSLIASAFSSVLVLTFSRSAVLAFAVGLAAVTYHVARKNMAFGVPLILLISSFAVTGVIHADLIMTRISVTERLEVKSVETRMQANGTFVGVFKRHPWIGVGPNAELLALADQENILASSVPLEPPHNVYLLVFISFGLIGAVLIFLIARSSHLPLVRYLPMVPLAVIGLFDHYLWTLWAGHALVALTVYAVFGNIPRIEEN